MSSAHEILLIQQRGDDNVENALREARNAGAAVHLRRDIYTGFAKAIAEDDPVTIVVLDSAAAHPSELEAVERLAALRPDLPILVLCENEQASHALRMIRLGASEIVAPANLAGILDEYLADDDPSDRQNEHDRGELDRTLPSEHFDEIDPPQAERFEDATDEDADELPVIDMRTVAEQFDEAAENAVIEALDFSAEDPEEYSDQVGHELDEQDLPLEAFATELRPHEGDAPHEEETASRAEVETGDHPREGDDAKPARVPWLRYTDGPARTPPRRAPAHVEPKAQERHEPQTAEPAAERRVAPARLTEPLLTDAELQALIGEDLLIGEEPDADTESERGAEGAR